MTIWSTAFSAHFTLSYMDAYKRAGEEPNIHTIDAISKISALVADQALLKFKTRGAL